MWAVHIWIIQRMKTWNLFFFTFFSYSFLSSSLSASQCFSCVRFRGVFFLFLLLLVAFVSLFCSYFRLLFLLLAGRWPWYWFFSISSFIFSCFFFFFCCCWCCLDRSRHAEHTRNKKIKQKKKQLRHNNKTQSPFESDLFRKLISNHHNERNKC